MLKKIIGKMHSVSTGAHHIFPYMKTLVKGNIVGSKEFELVFHKLPVRDGATGLYTGTGEGYWADTTLECKLKISLGTQICPNIHKFEGAGLSRRRRH